MANVEEEHHDHRTRKSGSRADPCACVACLDQFKIAFIIITTIFIINACVPV